MDTGSFSIGADNIRFTAPPVALPVGYHSLSKRYFHHNIPSPGEVEMAINVIEDAIQATPLLRTTAGSFNCADHFLKEIASVAGESARLTQQNIEQVFNRVADVAAGSPRQPGEFPADPEFICYLLIVRELSHHLNIQDINLTLQRPTFSG